MVTVFVNRIFFFNKRNQIVEQILLKGCKGLNFYAIKNISCSTIVLHSPSVGQYNNHGFNLLFYIKIIQYNLRLTIFQPFLLVATDTVKKVQNGILVFFRKSRRSINQCL